MPTSWKATLPSGWHAMSQSKHDDMFTSNVN